MTESVWAVILVLLGATGVRGASADLAESSMSRDEETSSSHTPTPKRALSTGETVCSLLPGRATILYLKPPGVTVKKGDLICELDPAGVRDRLARQRLQVERAQAEVRNARLSREAADLAVMEREAWVSEERVAVVASVAIAEAALELASTRLNEAKATHPEGAPFRVNAERERARAERDLVEARARRASFEATQRSRSGRNLASDLEAAKVVERETSGALSEALSLNEAIERQIELCRIVAPVSGRFEYVRWRTPGPGGGYAIVGQGAEVRERQPLFRITPVDREAASGT